MNSFDCLTANLMNNLIEINIEGLKKIQWVKDILE